MLIYARRASAGAIAYAFNRRHYFAAATLFRGINNGIENARYAVMDVTLYVDAAVFDTLLTQNIRTLTDIRHVFAVIFFADISAIDCFFDAAACC